MPPVAQPSQDAGSADPNAPLSSILTQWTTKHGPQLGQASITNPTIKNPDKKLPSDPDEIPNPNPTRHYTFQDGSTLDATWDGNIAAMDEKEPKATGQSHANVTDQSTGNTYIWDDNLVNADGTKGGYKIGPGLPQGTKPATQGQTRQAIDNGYNVTQTYDGGGWVTTAIGSKATPGASNPGDTRPAIESGRNVTQTFDGTNWRTTSIGGSAVPGAPNEGATRQAIESGRNVTQTFSNGQWITTGIGTSAIPGAAQKGDTRQVVESGRNVTQTFDGTNWTTTSIGGNAIPGAANEGDSRNIVEGGYHVTQQYKNGQWVTTDVGAKATPAVPTAVSSPADQPFITTIADGKLGQIANPNYQPKTAAQIAQQVTSLQQAAQQQKDSLASQVASGALTQQAAGKQFDQWWSQNVEPQKASLQAAQQQAVLDQQKAIQEQNRLNLSTAQSAGQTAVTAQTSMMPYRVGPGFGNMLGKMVGDWQHPGSPSLSQQDIASGVMFKAPDMNQVYQQATAQALAHISPTAAGIAGQGQPSMLGQDINQQLNRVNYQLPGVAPAPAAPAGATGGVPIGVAANVNAQNTSMPFGQTIGNNPMANAMNPQPYQSPQMPFGAIGSNPWGNYAPSF